MPLLHYTGVIYCDRMYRVAKPLYTVYKTVATGITARKEMSVRFFL